MSVDGLQDPKDVLGEVGVSVLNLRVELVAWAGKIDFRAVSFWSGKRRRVRG